MRRLKDIYPEFADSVAFYAVNVDPTDSLEALEEFRKREGYPWPVAQTDNEVLFRLHVTQQSTKVAFDSNGVIMYRARMGAGDDETWRKVFRELSES